MEREKQVAQLLKIAQGSAIDSGFRFEVRDVDWNRELVYVYVYPPEGSRWTTMLTQDWIRKQGGETRLQLRNAGYIATYPVWESMLGCLSIVVELK